MLATGNVGQTRPSAAKLGAAKCQGDLSWLEAAD